MFNNQKKNLNKKIISIIFVISIFSSSLLPAFAPRAQAIFGIGDIVIDAKALIRAIVDGIAMKLAQRMVDDMVKSSVQWAQSGFEGKPAFVTNPGRYFGDIADQTAGDFIDSSSIGFLCSPFQQSIRLSLRASYLGNNGSNYYPSCTVTGIKGNIEDFYDSFSNGTWDTWFSMTQDDNNNPYGAYLNASIELDSRVAKAVGIEKTQINWGDGFKTKGDCILVNASQAEMDKYIEEHPEGGKFPEGYNPNKKPGECLKYGEGKTPGTVIKDQLNKTLPSGLSKLITVTHVEQLVSAFTQGLLSKFVFGPNGLLGNGSNSSFDDDEVPQIGEPQISDTWTYCANEGEVCEFEGTRSVRFGSGKDETGKDTFIVKQFPSSITCNADLFEAGESAATRWCEFSTTQGTTNSYGPLKVSCYPMVAHAPKGSVIEWVAEITGGSGKRPFEEVDWKLNFSSSPNAEWHLESSRVDNVTDPNDPTKTISTTLHVFAQYNGVSGTKNNSITVVDPDPSVRVEQDVGCTSVYISG